MRHMGTHLSPSYQEKGQPWSALATVSSGHSNRAHNPSESGISPTGCAVSAGPMVSAKDGWGEHGLLYLHLLPVIPHPRKGHQ